MKRYIRSNDRKYQATGKMMPVKHGLVDYTAEGTCDGADCEIGYTDFGNGPEATHIFIKDHYKGDTHYDAQTIELSKSVKAYTELDERFSFDFDEFDAEFGLDTTTEYAQMFFEDSKIIGDGAGVQYTVVIAVPREVDHWQMKEDIEHNLERMVSETIEGSDYYGSVLVTGEHVSSYDVPDEVDDNCVLYRATIDIVPLQNIGPYGDYSIDAGILED